jgi:transposase
LDLGASVGYFAVSNIVHRSAPADVSRRNLPRNQHDADPWPGTYGTALLTKMSYGHWRTLTFIAGLRCDNISAPSVLDQPINKVSFLPWVRKSLVPTLRPGDIVVMDNLMSHKNAGARWAIRDAGARRLLLPPDSPESNPIEQMFAKLKALIRKVAERTVDGAWRRIRELVNQFTSAECANCPEYSGYASN